jgi:hypothetical protein
MLRKSRIAAPGAMHHIITRGIERCKIFRDDAVCNNFLDRLGGIIDDTGTVCFAWALIPEILNTVYDFNTLKEKANVLLFPSLDSGNIAYKFMARLGGAKAIEPILMGTSKSINVRQRDCEVEGIVNTTTLAVIETHGN